MGYKARLYLSALFIVIALVFGTNALTCNTINGNTYDTAGDLVTLYNIASATACCNACQNFVESQHWTYGTSALTCVCKSQNSGTLTANSAYISGDISRSTYTQSGVSCGTMSPSTDFSNGATNVKSVSAVNASACCGPCQSTIGCNAWTYYQGVCYLKGTGTGVKSNSATTSGVLSLPVAPLRTGRRGLGWFNSNTCTDILTLTNLAWMYNWNDNPPPNLIQCMMANGIEYVPMIWGKTIPVDTSTVYVAPNSKHLLTFNEPNFKSESNLSPAVAAAQWPAIQQFANAKGLLISSPAAAAGGSPDPISWLDQFFGNCTNCQVDFITTHIYTCSDVGTTGFLAQFKKYKKPIWLTEFDCPNTGSIATATNYVTNVVPLLDADPVYERYAFFGLRVAPGDTGVGTENSIFNSSSNALTALGTFYNTPPAASTTAAPTSSPTTVAATTPVATTTAATTKPATTAPVTTAAVTTSVATTPAATTVAATTAAVTTAPATTAPVTTAAVTTPVATTPAATTKPATTAAVTTTAATTAAPATTAPVTTPVATTTAATTKPATTAAVTTKAPVTTAAATTFAATTIPATTASPTTKAPTAAASTAAPSTAAPSTAARSTAAPTTAAATTAPTPTTASPSGIPAKLIIQSVSTSKWIVANSASGSILNATATTAAAASVFTSASITGGYSLYSLTLSAYVCGDNWGGSPLIANRGSASTWETFNFTKQASGYYTIISLTNNKFVEVVPSTSLLPDITVSSSPPTSALFSVTASP